jgi:hypothetical protein
VAGEELGLEVGELRDSDAGFEERMGDFFAFAGQIRLHHGLAAVGGEFDGASVSVAEAGGGDLLTVDEGEDEAVGDEGAEFFDEVESEAWATWAVGVEEADLRVETGGGEGGGAVVDHQGVED